MKDDRKGIEIDVIDVFSKFENTGYFSFLASSVKLALRLLPLFAAPGQICQPNRRHKHPTHISPPLYLHNRK